jgi:mono/diheme cytochrome c family protein
MNVHRKILAPIVIGFTVLAGNAAADEAPSADDAKRAKEIFASRCADCHGASGRGDGSMSGLFDPRPRDLTKAEWQDSVTDDYIEKIVLEGGPAVGKSMMMPANPDLKDEPQLVEAIRALVRGLRAE